MGRGEACSDFRGLAPRDARFAADGPRSPPGEAFAALEASFEQVPVGPSRRLSGERATNFPNAPHQNPRAYDAGISPGGGTAALRQFERKLGRASGKGAGTTTSAPRRDRERRRRVPPTQSRPEPALRAVGEGAGWAAANAPRDPAQPLGGGTAGSKSTEPIGRCATRARLAVGVGTVSLAVRISASNHTSSAARGWFPLRLVDLEASNASPGPPSRPGSDQTRPKSPPSTAFTRRRLRRRAKGRSKRSRGARVRHRVEARSIERLGTAGAHSWSRQAQS